VTTTNPLPPWSHFQAFFIFKKGEKIRGEWEEKKIKRKRCRERIGGATLGRKGDGESIS
jgi:hypothetical protein